MSDSENYQPQESEAGRLTQLSASKAPQKVEVVVESPSSQGEVNITAELAVFLLRVVVSVMMFHHGLEKFQDPESPVRFFVGNPQTGGYGITLTAANNVIYYSNGYDLEKRLQSEDRAHRIGQKKAVTYVDLIAPKTVDEKIRKALRKKINIATEIMGEELREWI